MLNWLSHYSNRQNRIQCYLFKGACGEFKIDKKKNIHLSTFQLTKVNHI